MSFKRNKLSENFSIFRTHNQGSSKEGEWCPLSGRNAYQDAKIKNIFYILME